MTKHRDSVLKAHRSEVATRRKSKPNMFWMATTFILLGVVLALAFTRGEAGDCTTGLAVLGEAEISELTKDYLNKQIPIEGITAEVHETTKVNSCLYKMELSVGPQVFESYITTDGKYLFPSAMDTTEPVEVETPEVPEVQEIPKTEKPVVDMYVMSQCPYGVQAEDSMVPVAELLGEKFEFNIHYIVSDNGDGTFQSLHGQPETDEDIRQLCVKAKEPTLFYDYLSCVNADYRNVADIWEGCATDAGIDVEAIKTCFTEEGASLLSADAVFAEEKGVGGSPTIEINGVRYQNARTPEAFKTAICGAFTEAPEECGEQLAAEIGELSGSC